MENKWLQVMSDLKHKHNSILNLLENKKIAYVDIPMHFNIGDLLIYLGTEKFIENNRLDVIYRCGLKANFKKMKEADVIMLHGGGNFGDLYPAHQSFREEIIKKFTDKIIICLPQSIHFDSKEELEKSADVFNKHQNYHFFVRDLESLEIAKKFTNNAMLMPDMAHSLHPLIDKLETYKEIETGRIRLLNMQRKDKESSSDFQGLSICKRSFDWDDIIDPSNYYLGRIIEKVNFLFPDRTVSIWNRISSNCLFNATNYFLSHDIVYSDRLHGIILSTLLGRKIKLYDNSYGKNTKYYSCWLEDYPFILK